MDRSRQLQHLEQAERHVLRGEQNVSDQEQRIEDFENQGYDVTLARALLDTFLRTQVQFVVHRDLILRELKSDLNECL
ncbi:hypothetical protein [Bradyrhizobium sp. SEMIA]|uniref:hypothetical protein n=1 Tax=Bradyrhizobium sp. SEMIA TaxID=2597515 RepID=UPI0018A62B0E|nr:hypothetical protein [Bradyrhizobium sp. SEMIA]QOG23403.1 hypothetical protein FOM02_45345 [Bradyrhizobium sp. SEMIA]